MKNIKIDFQWSGKEYGHKDFKKSNGRDTKYYVIKDDVVTEISIDDYSVVAEKYSRLFR